MVVVLGDVGDGDGDAFTGVEMGVVGVVMGVVMGVVGVALRTRRAAVGVGIDAAAADDDDDDDDDDDSGDSDGGEGRMVVTGVMGTAPSHSGGARSATISCCKALSTCGCCCSSTLGEGERRERV